MGQIKERRVVMMVCRSREGNKKENDKKKEGRW